MGQTSQKLRNRLNNHRSSLKRLPNLYLYHHFSSDGHTVDDISIMPIEEIEHSDEANVASLCLEREDYWCSELCTYYSYGLTDNVSGVGNISKKPGLVVNELFHEQNTKFRKRSSHRRRNKRSISDLA